jgi:hypothetical protein
MTLQQRLQGPQARGGGADMQRLPGAVSDAVSGAPFHDHYRPALAEHTRTDGVSDEFDIYGDADTGDVAAAQEHGGPDGGDDVSASRPPTNAGASGSPGVAVPGYPGLRAGGFGQGGGALGLYRVGEDQGAGASGAGLTPVAYFGKGPEVLPDYQTKSWRWNDPTAVDWDTERKRLQLGQVHAMTDAIEALGIVGVLPPWTGRAVGVAGALLGHGEAAHLQDQLDALEARRKQLKEQSSS